MTNEAGTSLIYRPYSESDIPFIRSSWANSYYKGCTNHKDIDPQEFHRMHRLLIDRFFERSNGTVVVVHFENEPDIIMGWIAVEIISTHMIIHYVYIKNSFKQMGILDNLIKRVNSKNKPIIITHLTDKARRIIQNNQKYRDCKYIPHLT